MVSFESFSRVSRFHLPLICFGDQYDCIFESINFSRSPHGSIRQYLLLAWERLSSLMLYICFGINRTCLFPIFLKWGIWDTHSTRITYSFSLFPFFHQIYWNSGWLYFTLFFWNSRYSVLLLLSSFSAIFGIEYPSPRSTRISWSSPSCICVFHLIIPPS